MTQLFNALLLCLLISCVNVGFIKNQDVASEKFLAKVKEAKVLSSRGSYKKALISLQDLETWRLSDVEKSLKDNLKGSLFFKTGNYPQAQQSFQQALQTAPAGTQIREQVKLNLASLYYKQKLFSKAWENLSVINPESLYQSEKQKYGIFKYKVAKELNIPGEGSRALLNYFEASKSYKEVVESPVSQYLVIDFSGQNQQEQRKILNSNIENNYASVLLIQKYLNQYMYSGDSSEVNRLISRLERFSTDQDVQRIAKEFREAQEGGQAFKRDAIGVVVPLTGKMARFGRSVLKGIDLALFDIYGENKPRVFVKDSHGNGVAAKIAVKELIEKEKVAYIIGGVFSSTSAEEYLEAKKYGTVFFSLSPIYLPFVEKSALLFEVFGSIESQVSKLLEEKNLNRNGRNFVMVYPNTEAGRVYYQEVLRQAPIRGANLIDAIPFTSGVDNYQETVKKLMGVGYVKKLVSSTTSELEKEVQDEKKYKYVLVDSRADKGSITNFKWAYIPAKPNDALQIIPNFRYYEARGVSYFGVPSWSTRLFRSRHFGLGKLFFVSSENSVLKKRFEKLYFERFKTRPNIVDEMSYESVSIAKRILEGGFNRRSQLVQYIDSLVQLEGFSSSWKKMDGIWLKDMAVFTIKDQQAIKTH